MSIELRYLGWSAFEVTVEDGRRLLLDPDLSGRPEGGIPPSPARVEEFDDVDFVLVTHVAQDHIGQAIEVLGRSKATSACDVATRFAALAGDSPPNGTSRWSPAFSSPSPGHMVKALPAEHLSFQEAG